MQSEVQIINKEEPWWTKCSNCGTPGWIFLSSVTPEIKKDLVVKHPSKALFWFSNNARICQTCFDNGAINTKKA